MSYFFGIILVMALMMTILVFLVKGLGSLKRESLLAKKVASKELVFLREDGLNILDQFSDFSIMDCGHSRRAFNVAHGKIGSSNVMAFDYCYEIGHGSRRATRCHSVVMVNIGADGWACVWAGQDVEHYPLIIDNIAGSVGRWSYAGAKDAAKRLAELADVLPQGKVSVELHRGWLMFSLGAVDDGWWDYTKWLDRCVELGRRLAG